MDSRLQLYSDIKAKIEEKVPAIAHIDLWNENVTYIEQEETFPLPALFIEFDTIDWQPVKDDGCGPCTVGYGQIRLHLVTEWGENSYNEGFTLLEKTLDALIGLGSYDSDSSYRVTYPTRSYTNHSHMELLENIEQLKVRYVRRWKE